MNTSVNSVDSENVKYYFAEEVSEALLDRAVVLMNLVAANEKTVGYSESLTIQQAESYKKWLRAQIDSDNSHGLLGVDEDELAVVAVLTQLQGSNNRHLVNAHRAIISPKYRGGMLMKNGLRLLAEKGKALGATTMLLDSTQGSRAESIWKRLGFIEYGVLPHYSLVNGEMKSGSYMYQDLDSLLYVLIN